MSTLRNAWTEMIIVYNRKNRKKAKAFVAKFDERFPYMRELNLQFTPEYNYSEYEEDLGIIKRGYLDTAEIHDSRDLPGYSGNVRLLLTRLLQRWSARQNMRFLTNFEVCTSGKGCTSPVSLAYQPSS